MELSNLSPLQIGKEVALSLLKDGIPVKARASGVSMLPWMKTGDIVTIIKTTPYLLGKGDIVVFKMNDKLILHRVISFSDTNDGRVIITKGDSRRRTDGHIHVHEVLGKAIEYERNSQIYNLTEPAPVRFSVFLANISMYTWPLYYVYFKFRAVFNRLKSI